VPSGPRAPTKAVREAESCVGSAAALRGTSLKTDHLVDQSHDRCRAFKIQLRALFSIQLSASWIVSKPLIY
jgi:hypothetical protein